MKITGIELFHVKSFKKLPKTNLANNINIFVGPNNSGKSIIIKSILSLQQPDIFSSQDITIGEGSGYIQISFIGGHTGFIENASLPRIIRKQLSNKNREISHDGNSFNHFTSQISKSEPDNLIYPYLSKRKVTSYSDTINEENANTVSGNHQHLFAKIDRLITPEYQPGNTEYLKACNDILGFTVSSLAKGQGKQAVYFIRNNEHIPLFAMGEGVANMLGLITDLCVAEHRIFLIEEIENDIHPKALKALLRFIVEKSKSNQFFISTHSNIVMKHLGAVPGSKIFYIENIESDEKRPNMRLSIIREIDETPEERRKVLEDLGYELFDFDLWKAWLFLEESSAEVIIRDYLIKWFTPELANVLRTFSANSTSRIKTKFDDFNRLFVFLHLEPTYKNKVWVYIDGGEGEEEIIEEMQNIYEKSGWNKEQFNQFSKHDFEEYYPEIFENEVKEVLGIQDKQEKRTAKKDLLDKLKEWIAQNQDKAKTEFEKSAEEIITILKNIQVWLQK